jgi:hypothetical protein
MTWAPTQAIAAIEHYCNSVAGCGALFVSNGCKERSVVVVSYLSDLIICLADESGSAASKGSILVFDKKPPENSDIVFESSDGAMARNKATARMRTGFKDCSL